MSSSSQSDTTTSFPAPALGLRLCPEMAVPDVCRGALTPWRQLQAALAELDQGTGAGLLNENMAGSPARLRAALAAAPGYLHGALPPADLYARFAWTALRVYEGARTFQMTLQALPGVMAGDTAGAAARTAFVRQVLAGPDGLSDCARRLHLLADQFAEYLRPLVAGLESAAGEARDAGTVPAYAGVTVSMSAFAHAQRHGDGMQRHLAQVRADAAGATVLAVVGNMATAIENLAAAWQATMTQFEQLAVRHEDQLGDVAFLREALHLDQAGRDWSQFVEILQGFIQRLPIG